MERLSSGTALFFKDNRNNKYFSSKSSESTVKDLIIISLSRKYCSIIFFMNKMKTKSTISISLFISFFEYNLILDKCFDLISSIKSIFLEL